MKYKVREKLEIRSKPSFESGIGLGILMPGYIIDAVNEVDDLNTGQKWLKDNNGFYYFKKAVEEAFPIKTEENISLDLSASKIPNWNSGNFDVTKFWPYTTGRGVKVAVIDSGIYQHKDLVDAIDRDNQKSFGSSSIHDALGHGTHVSGIIAARGVSDVYGVAPESKIVPIKVGDGRSFTNKNLTNAVDYASSIQGIKIINLSLKANSNDTAGINQLREAVNNAIKRGIIIVAPSGNDYRDIIDEPARFEGVVAVASVLRDDTSSLESYVVRRTSNYGNDERRVDICAPGVNISSCKNQVEGTVLNSGTSMSAAFISGIIALKLQKNPDMNVKDVLIALSNSIFKYASRQNDLATKLPVLDSQSFINLKINNYE